MKEELGEIGLLNADHLPQQILENIEDQENGKSILDLIRKLPLEYSTILMMKVILKSTSREVAQVMNVSTRTINKRQLKMVEMVSKIPKTE